jgi:hypothetical protein
MNIKQAAGRIDPENLDQLITLALAALFTTAAIARGAEISTSLTRACANCAKAVVDSVTTP